MVVNSESFGLDDVNEISQNLFEIGEERIISHDAEYSLSDSYIQIAHAF